MMLAGPGMVGAMPMMTPGIAIKGGGQRESRRRR